MDNNNLYFKEKIKVETWEGDPFGNVCCKPNIGVGSDYSAEEMRAMLIDRSNTKVLTGKFPSYDEFRSLLKSYLESIHK